jgi:glycosyltransferase involved in cell wall biosynthesis
VASAHYNLYRGLAGLGCDATLLTYNEYAALPDVPGILRCGASPQLRSLIGLGVAFWLKLLGSRGTTHQLHDIIASIPGSLCMNRQIASLDPNFLIIPDRGAPGLCLRPSRAKVAQVIHHVPMRFVDEPLLGDFCRIDAARATALEQRALRRIDGVVCPSNYIRNVFCEVYHFAGEVRVIPNAVDVPMIETIEVDDVRRHLGLAADALVVYIPSAGSPLKGARYVAPIINALSNSHAGPIGFYLSGLMGAEMAAELVQAPHNARIHSPGATSHAETIALLKSCSFGISPTLIENFSMALLEAGCCGVPMVTFDVGGNRELIADGDSGFLVPCHDLSALLHEAERLLQPEPRERMQAAARRHVRTQFNADVIAKKYLTFFEGLA